MDRKKKMTNANKINSQQKTILADFMATHPSLAQNLILNCTEGKEIAESLWATLTYKLNDVGPPFKDAKTWRKVFADQKYQAKKKLSFNITLLHSGNTDFYEQKRLTLEDQRILEASGLKLENQRLGASPTIGSDSGTATIKVESDDSVESFITIASSDLLDRDADFEAEKSINYPTETHKIHLQQFSQEDSNQSLERISVNEETQKTNNVTNTHVDNKRKPSQVDTTEEFHKVAIINNKKQKLNLEEDTTLKLINENSLTQLELQQRIDSKLDRLLDIQERMLKIREEEHKSVIALNLIKLQIKTMELDKLKASQ